MSNTTQTPNMLLILPVVSTEIGPAWATEVNAALSRVDTHDHSANLGVKITPAGMNMNSSLDMLLNSLLNIKAAFLADQGSTLGSTNQGCLYRNGSNLYYNNGAGASVQITSGSSVNTSGSGAISLSTIGSYPYTVVTGDAQKILAVDSSAPRTLNLPAASNAMFFMIKDVVGSAQTNNITVAPNGTDTIESVNASFSLNINFGSWGLVSDGVSAWYVV